MQAIVLSRRDFRENDQIISLYTRDKGKLELLARGVKKITSKNAAHLEPFSAVDIEVARGKEIDHLTKVQPLEFYKNIRQDMRKALMAGYVVSLLDKLIQVGERDLWFFDDLKSWLDFFNQAESISLFLIDSYVVKLLHCLGFDILYSDKIPSMEIKKDLEIFGRGDWQLINNLKFEKGEGERLHDFIYQFSVFHTELKIEDWRKLEQLN